MKTRVKGIKGSMWKKCPNCGGKLGGTKRNVSFGITTIYRECLKCENRVIDEMLVEDRR